MRSGAARHLRGRAWARVFRPPGQMTERTEDREASYEAGREEGPDHRGRHGRRARRDRRLRLRGRRRPGAAAGSPGVLSGNTVQVPVHVPVNVCGNTVNVVGLLNPAFGNHCANIRTPAYPAATGRPRDPGHRRHPGHPGVRATPATPVHGR